MSKLNWRFINPAAGKLLVVIGLLFVGGPAMAQDDPPRDDKYLIKAGDTLLVSVWK